MVIMSFRFFCLKVMSSTMKAVRIEKFGGPSVLQLQTVEQPVVTESKVLVEIASAGVNPVDTYIREGAFLNLPTLPFTPGKDGAGIVRSVGENVTKVKVGQKVFICRVKPGKYGTYAEYSLVDETDVFALPDSLSFDEGAALGIPYFTAYRALVIKSKCSPGETVLIHGASGAVGLAAVQIAKHLKLQVIGTAGTPEGMEIVKSCGADFVVCHRDKGYLNKVLEINGDKGVNIIIEMLANVNLDNDLDILAPRGRLAIVGSRGCTKIDPRKMMGPELQVFGVALLSSDKDEWEETTEAVQKMCIEGFIKPVIDRKYPLERAGEAHTDIISSSGAKGKLILTVQDNLKEC